MTHARYIGFVIATVILLIVPGPNIALIASNSLLDGWRRGFAALIGTKIALAIQLTVIVLALSSLTASERFVVVMRWGGVIGLAVLGLLALRKKPGSHAVVVRARFGSVVWHSFVLGILNPTVFFFFAPFLPAFVEVNQSVTVQLASLAGTFYILAVLIDGSYAAIAARVRRWLDFCRTTRLSERVTGATLMITAGILAIGGVE
jgi:homoserine/homoserine lactone efflux protein